MMRRKYGHGGGCGDDVDLQMMTAVMKNVDGWDDECESFGELCKI